MKQVPKKINAPNLFILIHLDSFEQPLEEVIPALHLVAEDVAGHVVSDVGAPGVDPPHGHKHEREHLRDKVDQTSVVDLPKDLVKLPDVVGVPWVGVRFPDGITEVVVEDVAAGLQQQQQRQR